MSLNGRDHELAVLTEALAGLADAPETRVVTIVGEPGIGKSALLGALSTLADDAGVRLLQARAADHERDVPFGLFADMLGDVVAGMSARRRDELEADLGPVLPGTGTGAAADRPVAGSAERFRLHRAVGALIEQLGRERPTVLAFDDVHRADAASAELLTHLLHRPPQAPVLLVLAMRPGDATPRLLDAARLVEYHRHLPLTALDDDAALALVRADVADDAAARRIVTEAAGHPLFLHELARASRYATGALPDTVVAAVTLELDRLDVATRGLADGAAVAGDPFDPELAAAAADVATEQALQALDELVAADLVRPVAGGRRFGWRHPLVHRVAYNATPPAWRLGAHERVDRRLAGHGADLITRAYHVQRSARPADEEAIAVLCGAAAEAVDRSPDAAATWYRAAIDLLPADDLERRAALLEALASAQSNAGRLVECRATLLEAIALRPHDPLLSATCARIEAFLGLHRDARRRMEAALARATPDDRPEIELELAFSAYFAQDIDSMGPHARAARAAPGQVGVGGLCLSGLAYLWADQPELAAPEIDEAAGRFARLDDAELTTDASPALYLGMAELLSERTRAAEATLSRGIECVRRTSTGAAGILPTLLFLRGQVRRPLLDLDGALADLRAAEESARLVGRTSTGVWALGGQVDLLVERGETAEAARAAAAFEQALEGAEESRVVINMRCAVAASRLDSDPERCLEDLVRHGGPTLELADPTWSIHLLRVLVRAALAVGRADDARRWAQVAHDRAAAWELPASIARGTCALAEVALADDDADPALALAGEALERAEASDTPGEIAECSYVLGRARSAAGDRDGAVAAFEDVVARAGAAGAVRQRDRATRELRALGVRVSAGARRGAAAGSALSPREQEVAALVAEGKANREVAAALFVSEKTVEYHLSHIYEKLGVRSRVELAGHLAAT